MYKVEFVKEECIKWIKSFFDENGKDCNAIVGISGGKDSSVVAALCVQALGRDKVIGVLLPQGEQPDIDYAKMLVDHLGIRYYIINIKDILKHFIKLVKKKKNIGEASVISAIALSDEQKSNIEKRLLETTSYNEIETTYAVDKSLIGGLVIRIEDRVVDSSIKTKLDKLSKTLANA